MNQNQPPGTADPHTKPSQKPPVLLLIYGDGGHRTEMARLVRVLLAENKPCQWVSLGHGQLANVPVLAHYACSDIRHKTSRLRSLINLLPNVFGQLHRLMLIQRQFQVIGVLSTGPGLCILPMLFYRLLGVKTVFIETFCRFYTRSLTGRIMYYIAHRFLIQNRQLQDLYPKAQFSGRL